MENKVIKYRESDHNSAFRRLESLNKKLIEFGHDFKTFSDSTGMPALDLDLLREVMQSGKIAIEQRIQKYVDAQPKPLQTTYLESCYQELGKMDQFGKLLREQSSWATTNGAEYFPDQLKNPNNLPLDKASLSLKLDEGFFKSITGLFEVTIESEVDLKLFERYEAIRKAVNEFYAYGQSAGVWVPPNFERLFPNSSGVSYPKLHSMAEQFLPSRKL